MKKLIIMLVLTCLISISNCRFKKNNIQKETKQQELLKPFIGKWNGVEESSEFELIVTEEPQEGYITVKLLKSGNLDYKYLCTINEVSNDRLNLKYQKLKLKLKVSKNELIYMINIDDTEKIEGTSPPMKFDKV